MARRVEPQPRGTGGKFVKRAAPAEPAPAAPKDDAVPVLDYGDPAPPPAPRKKRTAKSTAGTAKPRKTTVREPAASTASTDKDTVPRTVPARRALGFRDGLLGPFGLGRSHG